LVLRPSIGTFRTSFIKEDGCLLKKRKMRMQDQRDRFVVVKEISEKTKFVFFVVLALLLPCFIRLDGYGYRYPTGYQPVQPNTVSIITCWYKTKFNVSIVTRCLEKNASIPSLNVCMNCLLKYVQATEKKYVVRFLQKSVRYTRLLDYDPETQYGENTRPVEWVG
jgi:hypothetical protein